MISQAHGGLFYKRFTWYRKASLVNFAVFIICLFVHFPGHLGIPALTGTGNAGRDRSIGFNLWWLIQTDVEAGR